MKIISLFLATLVQSHLQGVSIAELRLPLEGEMEPEELTELMDLVVLEARARKQPAGKESTV